ncbi:hypothetical protein BXZ70DRAFT_868758, partial [Cristinia sonorae]
SWYYASRDLSIQLSVIFKVFMPRTYKVYKERFDALVWIAYDVGPFNGRTVVYKLQLYAHVDPGEAGPTISFSSGYFEGGYMEVPQLGARRLRYNSGSIFLAPTGILAHRVAPWTGVAVPAHLAARGITPGRIGTVYMFPRSSFNKAEGKKPGWGIRTGFGRIP